MAFDVFISYPHQDKAIADAMCAKLEAQGIRCWIAPRDIAPSADWAASIVEAIENCQVMVLIFSGHTNRSKQVSREVQQAFDGEKPVIPFRIENVAPEKSLRYYMGSVHWLDALTPPVEHHLQRLAAAVQALLEATRPEGRPQREAEARGVTQRTPPHVKKDERSETSNGELTRAAVKPALRLARSWIWKVAAISLLLILSSVAIFYYTWRSPLKSATSYSSVGNFACFDDAEYPKSWRGEASLCAPYGCNFGKMSQDACLSLGAKKQSKMVIHGNTGTTRAGECWLQQSCGNLQPHSEFTEFKM
jgi:hypothetical protein